MSREALSRLQKEFQAIQKEAIPNAIAVPDHKNWLRWHYAIYGLDAPFHGGVYHGELRFPANYPMGPPTIIMHTPNGRFIPEHKICTSMSDFHPESWSPIWKVSTIVTGLISFMQENERSTGCEVTSYAHKEYLAKNSMKFNLGNPLFVNTFTDYLSTLEKFTKKDEPSVSIPVSSQSAQKNWMIILGALLFLYLCSSLLSKS